MKGEDLSFSGGQPSRLKKLWDVARRKFAAWSCELAAQAEGLRDDHMMEGAGSLRADGRSCCRDNR